jgi:hypothetical protein
VAPAAKAAKKGKKKKGGADGSQQPDSPAAPKEAPALGDQQELDPEKAAKKVWAGAGLQGNCPLAL